jgi:hypothetical protein
MASDEPHPKLERIAMFLARLLRAAAAVLERRTSGQAATVHAFDRAMAMLQQRYPDAPEHWLRFIAERTPAAGTAGSGPGEPDVSRSGIAQGEAPPGSTSKRPPLLGLETATWPGQSVGREPGDPSMPTTVAGDSANTGKATVLESQPSGKSRRPNDESVRLRDRGTPSPSQASPLAFFGPRFHSAAPSPQARAAGTEPIPNPATRRVMRAFPRSGYAPPSASRRVANPTSDEPAAELPRTLPGLSPQPPEMPKGGAAYRAVGQRRTAGAAVAFQSPAVGRSGRSGTTGSVTVHRTVTDKDTAGRSRSDLVTAIPASTKAVQHGLFAPDEPEWPELPENPPVWFDREQVRLAREPNPLEESYRWNALPF